jgi:hypothetical protein
MKGKKGLTRTGFSPTMLVEKWDLCERKKKNNFLVVGERVNMFKYQIDDSRW